MKTIFTKLISRPNRSRVKKITGGLKCRSIEIIQTGEREREREQSSEEPWDNIQCFNMHLLRIPKGQERENSEEKIR